MKLHIEGQGAVKVLALLRDDEDQATKTVIAKGADLASYAARVRLKMRA